jgi:SLOG cluster3 family/TIR domain
MNIVYIVSPLLTLGSSVATDSFLDKCTSTLSEFCIVSPLQSAAALRMTEPDSADVIVFLNRPDVNYEKVVIDFLQKGSRSGATILPVAMTIAERHPPSIVADRQSFDVHESLRQRALDPSQSTTVAIVFARQVMSILKPTLIAEPMHLFLSRRRLDGEDITAAFDRVLRATAQKSFRDLFDVRVGEDAQHVIEERLRASDAVIFLDRPKTGESPWITKELQLALSLKLPIVWVRLGSPTNRVPLTLLPAGAPHFNFPEWNPVGEEVDAKDVEQIVQEAFSIHHRDYVDRLFDELGKLKDIAHQHNLELKSVDPRRMLYSLALPRKTERYRERPLTHLLQLFGRSPSRHDFNEFSACAKDGGYEPHPKHGAHYDSAILLAAIPSQPMASFDECGVHTDSISDYVAEITRVTTPPKSGSKRIVISGAFADCEPEFQQNMTNAVHAIVETSLRAGRNVSFGAHPTFQFMIFDLAKRLRPGDFQKAVRMYVSRHFVTEATISEFRDSAQVIPTDDVNGDRVTSLTLMRRAMLQDPDAGALVVIGGKTSRGGHVPGVDEEIQLALQAKLPVFVFGSVGGRSSELSAAATAAKRAELSRLPDKLNEELASSFDYSRLSQMIMEALT